MVQRGRMAGDRPRGRRALRVEFLSPAQVDDLLFNVAVTAALVAAFCLGWLVAEHVDRDGALLRWTLGWVVGEFR